MAIRKLVFDDHGLVRKFTKNQMDLAASNGIDCFAERSLQVDSRVQVPGFVTLPVFTVGTDNTALDGLDAFPVGIIKGRIERLLYASLPIDETKHHTNKEK